MSFGDYAPFLEVSVAINLLIGVWSALWRQIGDSLTNLRTKWFEGVRSKAANVSRIADVNQPPALLIERPNAFDVMVGGMPVTARVTAALVVTGIASALFLVDPDGPPTRIATFLIGASPFAQPVLMFVALPLFFVGYAVGVWIPYRRFRRHAIKTIERVHRADADDGASPVTGELRLDGGDVLDANGHTVASIRALPTGTFITLVLADVFEGQLDITHPTSQAAFEALHAAYRP